MEDLRVDFWNANDFSEIEEPYLEPFMMYLRKWSKKAAESRNFEDAKISRDMGLRLQELLGRLKAVSRQVTDPNAYFNEESKLRRSHEERLKEIHDKFDNEIDWLGKRQKDELEMFETKWFESSPLHYRKPSKWVLDLQRREESLIKTNNIDQAEDLQAEIEEIYTKEQLLKQEKLIDDYRFAKGKILVRFERELQLVEDEREQKCRVEEVRYADDLRKLDLRFQILESKYALNYKKDTALARERDAIWYNSNGRKLQLNTSILLLKPPNDQAFVDQNNKSWAESYRKNSYYQEQNAPSFLIPTLSSPYKSPSKSKSMGGKSEKTLKKRAQSDLGVIGIFEKTGVNVNSGDDHSTFKHYE